MHLIFRARQDLHAATALFLGYAVAPLEFSGLGRFRAGCCGSLSSSSSRTSAALCRDSWGATRSLFMSVPVCVTDPELATPGADKIRLSAPRLRNDSSTSIDGETKLESEPLLLPPAGLILGIQEQASRRYGTRCENRSGEAMCSYFNCGRGAGYHDSRALGEYRAISEKLLTS